MFVNVVVPLHQTKKERKRAARLIPFFVASFFEIFSSHHFQHWAEWCTTIRRRLLYGYVRFLEHAAVAKRAARFIATIIEKNSLQIQPYASRSSDSIMKKVRLMNFHNNGDNSKVNVYFEDGTEWHRTVTAYEVTRLAHEGEAYLEVLLKKYKNPQPKPEFLKGYFQKVFM